MPSSPHTQLLARRLLAGLAVLATVGGLLAQAALANASPPWALADSLVAYWALGEASGSRADSAGSNTLSDNGSVTSDTGKLGDAAVFGSNKYLSITDNAAVSAGDIDFTLAGWIYMTSKADYQIIAAKWAAIPNSEYQIYYDQPADRFKFQVSGNGTASTTVTASNFGSPSTNTWYFIQAWHDAAGDTINISVNNGTANSAAHTTGIHDGTNAFRLSNTSASGSVIGRLDEWGIWKRLLTSTERGYLYNGAAGCTYPFTVCEATPTPTPAPSATPTLAPILPFVENTTQPPDQHNFWYWLLEGVRNLVGVLSGRMPLYAPIGMGPFIHNLLAAAATPILFYLGSIWNLCWMALVFGLMLTSELARGIMAAYRTIIKAVPLP